MFGRIGRASALLLCAALTFVSNVDADEGSKTGFRYLPSGEQPWLLPLRTLSVDPSTGTTSDSIPLPLPPLPDSFHKSGLLSLNYVAGRGDGPLGTGWSMSLGHLAPSAGQEGQATPQELDVSFPGGGGQVIQLEYTPGVYRPRIQTYFFQVQQGTATSPYPWTVWDADGIRYDYSDINHSGAFELTRITDRFNNYVTISYQTDTTGGYAMLPGIEYSPATYLKSISYTSNDAMAITPAVSIQFAVAPRRFPLNSAAREPGIVGTVVTGEEYTQVAVYTGSTERTVYSFHYDDDCAGAGHSCPIPATAGPALMLSSITAADWNPPGSVAFGGPEDSRVLRQFEYDSAYRGFGTEYGLGGSYVSGSTTLGTLAGGPTYSTKSCGAVTPCLTQPWDLGIAVVDVNGDGFADLVNNLSWIGYNSRPAVTGFSFTNASTDPYMASLAALGNPTLVNPSTGVSTGWMLVDVDQDGRPDLVDLTGATSIVAMNTGAGWSRAATPPALVAGLTASYYCMYGNVNGGVLTQGSCSLNSLYSGPTSAQNPSGEGAPPIGTHDAGLRFVDVNGDGANDIIVSLATALTGYPFVYDQYATITAMVLLQTVDSTGAGTGRWYYSAALSQQLADYATIQSGAAWTGYTGPVTTGIPAGQCPYHVHALSENGAGTGVIAIDINGDGRVDFVDTNACSASVFLGTGNGWYQDASYTAGLVANNASGPTTGNTLPTVRFVDFDGDRLPDAFVQPASGAPYVLRNTGSGFGPDAAVNATLSATGAPTLASGVYFGDVDGDSFPDIITFPQVTAPTLITGGTVGYAGSVVAGWGSASVFFNAGTRRRSPNYLTAETNEAGGRQEVLYQSTPSEEWGPGLTTWNEISASNTFELPAAVIVASELRSCNDTTCQGSPYVVSDETFAYSNGLVTSTGFHGFSTTTIKNAVDGTSQVFTFNPSVEAYRGFWLTQSTRRADGTEAQLQTKLVWDTASLGITTVDYGRTIPFTRMLTVLTEDVGATPVKHQYGYSITPDNYGNLLYVTDYGPGDGTDENTRQFSYTVPSTDGHAVNLKWLDAYYHFATLVSQAESWYDYGTGQLVAGTPSVGALTASAQWLGASSGTNFWSPTSLVLDGAGRITTVTDADNIVVSAGYTGGFLPTSRTRASTEVNLYTYDPLTGRIATESDPNSAVLTFGHGAYGQTTSMTPPGVAPAQATTFQIVGIGTLGNECLVTLRPIDLTQWLTRRECFDGFGRVTHVEDGDGGANITAVDSAYDSHDRVVTMTTPYAMPENPFTGTGPASSTFVFDALGRITKEIDPYGTKTTQYLGLQRIRTDYAKHQVTETLDTHGNVLTSSEVVSGVTRLTKWTYTPTGKVQTVTDPSLKTTTFVYDSADNLIATQDADLGWSYVTHTLAGRVWFETRADGTQLVYAYDNAGRPKTMTAPDQTVTYNYGTTYSNFTIGRVASVTNGTTTTNLTYDPRGNVASQSQTSGASTMTLGYQYWPGGALESITYPDGVRVEYDYNSSGEVLKVASPTQVYLASANYNFMRKPLNVTFGNGVQSSFTYDPSTGLPQTAAIGAGGLFAGLTYDFVTDPNHHLRSVVDTASAGLGKRSYTYDEAGELKTASGNWGTESYIYDVSGNLTSKTNSIGTSLNYAIDPNHPHQVNCVTNLTVPGTGFTTCPTPAASAPFGTGSVTYDKRGNVLGRGGETFKHDSLNRLIGFTGAGGANSAIGYDAFGTVSRMTTVTSAGVTDTFSLIGNIYEQHATYAIRQIVVNGQRIASEQVVTGTTTSTSTAAALGVAGIALLLWFLRGIKSVVEGLTPRFFRLSLALVRQALGDAATLAATARRRSLAVAVMSVAAFVTVMVFNMPNARAAARTPGNTIEFFHADLVGSVTVATDAHGVLARRSEYRPFGEFYSESLLGTDFTEDRLGFQGSDSIDPRTSKDPVAGPVVSHMGARHYDAILSRFLEQDDRYPQMHDPRQLNRYAFAGNNPVSHIDPSGHGLEDACLFGLAFIGAVVAIAYAPELAPFFVEALGPFLGVVAAGMAMGALCALDYALIIDTANVLGIVGDGWTINLGHAILIGLAAGAVAGLMVSMPMALGYNITLPAALSDINATATGVVLESCVQGLRDIAADKLGDDSTWFTETSELFLEGAITVSAATFTYSDTFKSEAAYFDNVNLGAVPGYVASGTNGAYIAGTIEGLAIALGAAGNLTTNYLFKNSVPQDGSGFL